MPEQPDADGSEHDAPTDMWGWAVEHQRPIPFTVYQEQYNHGFESEDEPTETDTDMIEEPVEPGRLQRLASWLSRIGSNAVADAERIARSRRDSIKQFRK